MSDEDCLEEDHRTFIIDQDDIPPSPSKKSLDLGLNFAKVEQNSYEHEETGIQEQSVLVVFELPDGSLGESYVSS